MHKKLFYQIVPDHRITASDYPFDILKNVIHLKLRRILGFRAISRIL